MNRAVYVLLLAQFLTAFADNAILFTAFAMIAQAGGYDDWYRSALQASFLVAFVVLAPWVGRFADQHPKNRVLAWGNGVKAAGVALLLAGVDPLLSYGVVGIGAAVYGPAKYGILPDLVGHGLLVKANGLVEGSTILAIVLGAVIGAHLADHSIGMALALVGAAYLASLAAALFLPRTPTKPKDERPVVGHFVAMMEGFFTTARARFAMLGSAVFWSAAVVLRVMMVAWAPVVLMTHNTADIADLTVFIAIGIAVGAVLAPRIVSMEKLRRARLAAYLMGLGILALGITTDALLAKFVLLGIGVAGGIFVVPINATLQDIGHRSIGAGGAVAIQNFFENLAMLVGTGIYSLALTRHIDPVQGVLVLGVLVIIATAVVAWHLPKGPEPLPEALKESA
ncbi:MAG: lysophospholipid transporter LplT [Thiobacillus sp.]|nr:lysophospholipid transporter LplT [Thiobacillus sp.]